MDAEGIMRRERGPGMVFCRLVAMLVFAVFLLAVPSIGFWLGVRATARIMVESLARWLLPAALIAVTLTACAWVDC